MTEAKSDGALATLSGMWSGATGTRARSRLREPNQESSSGLMSDSVCQELAGSVDGSSSEPLDSSHNGHVYDVARRGEPRAHVQGRESALLVVCEEVTRPSVRLGLTGNKLSHGFDRHCPLRLRFHSTFFVMIHPSHTLAARSCGSWSFRTCQGNDVCSRQQMAVAQQRHPRVGSRGSAKKAHKSKRRFFTLQFHICIAEKFSNGAAWCRKPSSDGARYPLLLTLRVAVSSGCRL